MADSRPIKNYVAVFIWTHPVEEENEDNEQQFRVMTSTGYLSRNDSSHPHGPSKVPHKRHIASKKLFTRPKKDILSPETNPRDFEYENILGAIPFPLENIEWELYGCNDMKPIVFASAEEILAGVLTEARGYVEYEEEKKASGYVDFVERYVGICVVALKRVLLEEYNKMMSMRPSEWPSIEAATTPQT